MILTAQTTAPVGKPTKHSTEDNDYLKLLEGLFASGAGIKAITLERHDGRTVRYTKEG